MADRAVVEGVYWTLGVEIVFYTTVGALIASGTRHRLADLLALIGLWSAAYWALRTALSLVTGDGDVPWLPNRVEKLLLLYHGCFLATGGLLWLRLMGTTSRRHAAMLALSAATCVIAILPLAIDRARDIGMPALAVLPPYIWAASLLAMAMSVRADAWLARWVPTRFAAMIGLLTYPLYLLHQQVGAAMMDGLGLSPGASAALAMIAMPLLALAVLLGLEQPLRRLIARRLSPAPHTGSAT